VNLKRRQKQLQSSLSSARLDALLVTHLPNIRYLCGFTGSAGALLVTERQCVFFTDGRYTAQARAEVSGARIVIGKKAPMASLAEWLQSQKAVARSLKRMGFEGDYVSFTGYKSLAKAMPSGIKLSSASSIVERIRIIKDSDELALMRSAAVMGASLFDRALEVIRPGTKEIEVAAEMQDMASKAGAEGMSFSTIIAAGERSALPHGRASGAPIPPDGFVVCDFGVILAGYCSDRTRTVYVGRPSEEARSAYEAVREAQQAALDAVRPGQKLGEVDGAARKTLQKHKLAKYFTHSTGHGVGLEIHEAPRVAAGQEDLLKPGMVITIEPGVYLPGKFGIRIEDMAVVTETGCEVLAPSSKELIVC
jgi:Xaa-Pro aminopeptidase